MIKKIIETKEDNIKRNIDDDNIDSDDDNVDNVDSDDSDKTPFETEIKDNINHKITLINKIYIRLAKAKTEITNKIKLVHEEIDELENNSRLRLVKLNKTDAILDDAINVVRYGIYGKKRKGQKMINIDKCKDIDGYVNKLTDITNNKIKLVRTISIRINSIMRDINNILNMVNKNVDNDTLHLVDDVLDKFIKYLIIKKI